MLFRSANEAGEKIVVGEGKITVMAKFFSTYAIGYTETTGSDTPEFPVVPDVPVYPFLPPVVNTNETNCTKGNTCPMHPYVDLDKKLWYHNGVHYCIENGLMTGLSATQFAPNMETSRAMIVTILWRLEGKPVVNYLMQFEDVSAETWYTEAVRWAASEKIVEGYNKFVFGTNDAITREQFATILWHYAKAKGYDLEAGEGTDLFDFQVALSVSEYAVSAMKWACGSSLMEGDGVKLTPTADATRVQAAALFQRFCEEIAE